MSKSIFHPPIRGVMAEVKTELLWTTNVTPAPTNMAMYPDSHPHGYGRSVETKRGETEIIHISAQKRNTSVLVSSQPVCCNLHPKQLIKVFLSCLLIWKLHLHIQLLHVDTLCKILSGSRARPPVLMTLWITFATWPLRRELSSLTRSIRQVQRTAREPARRIRPTVRSDSPEDTNKCLPAEWQDQQSWGNYPTTHIFFHF